MKTNKNVVTKKEYHSREFPSGIYNACCLRKGTAKTCVENPRLRPSGMTSNLTGFTLIELLVVVLIIGILAAVALPQYQKAVKKAQGREVIVAINALDKALAMYALEHKDACNGDVGHCNQNDGLDIEIPSTKYFVHTGTGIDPFTLDVPQATFESKAADATLIAKWDVITGKRVSTSCNGDGCSSYFDCSNIHTAQLCYDAPWDGKGYCPSPSLTTACDVNI